MNGQKVSQALLKIFLFQMQFEHYFLNKILKVIYLPSWRGVYIVFLVEAHLGITRFPSHLTRQTQIKKHITKLRKDRYKCRKTYRVFVGQYKDPMAYQDFIWKFISQAITAFDPQNETNIFNIKNIRHFYEPIENNQNNQSLNQSGVLTNHRNSLYELIQNLKTPGGLNSSAHESFFTIDNKPSHPKGVIVGGSITPVNHPQHHPNHSLSSFNFSDISKIEDMNQTPGGFMSGIFGPTPKGSGNVRIISNPYSIMEPNEQQPKIQQVQRSQKARTFADRVDESLQTLEGIKRKNFSPMSNQLNNKKRELMNKNQVDVGGSYKGGYGLRGTNDGQNLAPARQYVKGYSKDQLLQSPQQCGQHVAHHHKISSDVPQMLPLDHEDQQQTELIASQMKYMNQREPNPQQLLKDQNFASQNINLHKKVYIRQQLNDLKKNKRRMGADSQFAKVDIENQQQDEANDTLLSVTQDAGQGQGGQQIVRKQNIILVQNQKDQVQRGIEEEKNFDRNDDNVYADSYKKNEQVDTRQLSFSEIPQSAAGFLPVTKLNIDQAMKKEKI